MLGYNLKYTDPEVRRKLTIIGVIVAVAIAVIGLLAWKNWYDYRRSAVLISNYPAELSRKIKGEIEMQLRRTLEMGVEVDAGAIVWGEVREGTFVREEVETRVYNSEFLVDIDEYKQTFSVSASWSEVPSVVISDGVTVLCPTYDLMKYPGTRCVSAYNSSDSIEMYLPHSGETANGQYFVVRQRQYLDGSNYLEIAVDSCGDQKILEAAKEATWEWIRSVGIDPEMFEYELPTHYCPGGAS